MPGLSSANSTAISTIRVTIGKMMQDGEDQVGKHDGLL